MLTNHKEISNYLTDAIEKNFKKYIVSQKVTKHI